MSLVSVIIPAFNQHRFVAKAVASALVQTHPDLEVIVVDDGSTDETPDVLRQFEGRANTTIIRQDNAGLPAARNRGLAAARGQFVCFLDSDDELAPTYAARLLEPLQADDSLGFAYCDVQVVDEEGEPSSAFSVREARHTVTGDIFESLVIGGYFPPHAAMVRKRLLDELGGFDLALGGHADYELWLRLAAEGHRAAFVEERLAVYRVYAGSMSKDLEHMRDTRIEALERIARRAPARLARALSAVQELSVDLHTANRWLRERIEPAVREAERAQAGDTWSLIGHLADARLKTGEPDQLAVWDTTIGDLFARAVFLHPPASLEVVIPAGGPGRITTAVALHPDAWAHGDACACVFSINVDDAVAGTVILDPVRRPADRRWIEWSAQVTASTTGRHRLTLETQGIDHATYGWALFRDVKFKSEQ